jgi:hypothetical protein
MSEHLSVFRLRTLYDRARTAHSKDTKPLTTIFEVVWPELPVKDTASRARRYLRSALHPANHTRAGII